MEIPSELQYTNEHEWIRTDEDGKTAVIGITAYAQGELGDIVFIELEPEGSKIEKDEVFGTVEAVKTVSELYMPITGVLIEINAELETNPEFVNDDPYGNGWMIKVEMSDLEELESLLSAEKYADLIR